MKLRDKFPEIEILSKDVDPIKFKIIGSYLYRDDFHDIDIVTADIETGWKIRQNAKENNIKVQIAYMSEDEFMNIENLLTFKNTSFTWWNGGYKFGGCFVDNDRLEFNNESLKKFKNSTVIFKEIEKMIKRGFIL